MKSTKDKSIEFLQTLGFQIEELETRAILATKTLWGTPLSYYIRFEDKISFSQRSEWTSYVRPFDDARRSFPSTVCYVVATEEVKAGGTYYRDFCRSATSASINVLSFREFLDTFIDLGKLKENTLRNISLLSADITYVPSGVTWDTGESGTTRDLLPQLWLEGKKIPRLVIVHAPAGHGKTLLAERVAQWFFDTHERKTELPIPFLIKFGEHRLLKDIDDLITRALATYGLVGLTASAFKCLLHEGRLVLILDGFDELAEEAGESVSLENIRILAEDIRRNPEARIILTCRSTFLITSHRSIEHLGSGCGRGEFRKLEISPFNLDQQREFLEVNPPSTITPVNVGPHRDRVLTLLKENERIKDIATSPLHLKMLSEIVARSPHFLPRNTANLFDIFLEQLCERECERQGLEITPTEQVSFLESLAYEMVYEGEYSYPIDIVAMLVEDSLKAYIESVPDPDAKKMELVGKFTDHAALNPGVASTLYAGIQFLHPGIRDYLAARRLHLIILGSSEEIEKCAMSLRHLPEETIRFLAKMMDEQFAAQMIRLFTVVRNPFLFKNLIKLLLAWEEGIHLKEILMPLSLTHRELKDLIFDGIDFSGYSFESSNLDRASFIDCDLKGCNFRHASLKRASFENCVLDDTEFQDLDTVLIIDGAEYHGSDVMENLAKLGAKVPGERVRPEHKPESSVVDMVHHVLRKFFRGADLATAKRIARHQEVLERGLSGDDRSFVRTHVLPALIANQYLRIRKIGTRSRVEANPTRSAEIAEFLFTGKVSEGLETIFKSFAT